MRSEPVENRLAGADGADRKDARVRGGVEGTGPLTGVDQPEPRSDLVRQLVDPSPVGGGRQEFLGQVRGQILEEKGVDHRGGDGVGFDRGGGPLGEDEPHDLGLRDTRGQRGDGDLLALAVLDQIGEEAPPSAASTAARTRS
ncbi:hypothetical protein GCM10029992_50820 [Glycomyces albus]